MGHSELHKKKLKKNLFVLFLLCAFVALVFGITIAKMAHADDDVAGMIMDLDLDEAVEEVKVDGHSLNQAFSNSRRDHMVGIDVLQGQYKTDGEDHVETQARVQSQWADEYVDTAAGQ